jgi:hypothetical protein
VGIKNYLRSRKRFTTKDPDGAILDLTSGGDFIIMIVGDIITVRIKTIYSRAEIAND